MANGKIHSDYDVKDFILLSSQTYERMGIRYGQSETLKHHVTLKKDVMELNHFIFTYNKMSKHEQLDIESIKIPTNEVVAIIGNNGSGKSTFAQCLSGLLKRFKGQVLCDNEKYHRKQLLRQSYMVFQDVNTQLFTECLDQELRLQNIQVSETQSDALLNHIHLLDKKFEHPLALSGGEKQRMAIATALLSSKEMIVFDEPTSGLDLYHMQEIAKLISDLHAKGKKIFIITHDKSLILELCTYVLHFSEGRIVNHYALDNQGLEHLNPYFNI